MANLAELPDLKKTEYRLFNVPIHALEMQEVVQKVEQMIQKKQQGYLITADASTIVTATKDPEFMEVIQKATLITPDSAGILWAVSKLYNKIIQKVSGVELAELLCKLSSEKGYKICFLGAEPGIAELAARNLTEKYPGCQIIGAMHGFFNKEDELSIAKKIAMLKPDILLVALGMPRQEKFIEEFLPTIGALVGIGVGGSFDVYSQKTKRAPVWFQKNRLEWLWRLALNPTKISKVKLLPIFVKMVKKEYGKNIHKNRR